MRIAFDVGGVLSKYPKFVELLKLMDIAENRSGYGFDVYVISDVHPRSKIQAMLKLNDIHLLDDRVYSADYAQYGEECKKILCEQLGIDILIDDFIGYVTGGDFIRLLVMPNPKMDYYHEKWVTDGTERKFPVVVGKKNVK